MKASIKLVTTEKPSENGYPIYVFLRDAKKSPKKKVIGHSFIEYWDNKNNEILKTHPDYDFLIVELLEYRSKVYKINKTKLTYSEAFNLLFGEGVKVYSSFYDLALSKCKGTPSEGINTTALNSFNKFYPGIAISDITRDHAVSYMDYILTFQKPNGVHTYMRKLSALFTLLSADENPFKGVRPKKESTPAKELDDDDLKLIFNTRTIAYKKNHRTDNFRINRYRYYYMLLFYLGGIDCVDLKELRYDRHVFNGRIRFKRNKGGTDAYINNKIFPKAKAILDMFDCYPYLVPIYEYSSYRGFLKNMNTRFYESLSDLELSDMAENLKLKRKPLTKSARYSFINRAQQLLIDERITMELVGHTKKGVHSIYTNEFPLSVRDEAHRKIIDF